MKKIETSAAPAAIGPYSQGIKIGNVVYCSGTDSGRSCNQGLSQAQRLLSRRNSPAKMLGAVLAQAAHPMSR